MFLKIESFEQDKSPVAIQSPPALMCLHLGEKQRISY